MARHLGELPELETRMRAATALLTDNDRAYVLSRGNDPVELLISLKTIDCEGRLMSEIEAGLQCFVASPTEPWIPTSLPDQEVAESFGLRRSANEGYDDKGRFREEC